MAERGASRKRPAFIGDAARLAERARRKRVRNLVLLAVLLGFAALLYALTLVRLGA